MLKIYAIETNQGYYISTNPEYNYSNWDILENRLFNGKLPESTFHDCWKLIKDKPIKITRIEKQPNTNYRFILKDDSLKSDKLPIEISKEKVGSYQKNCNDDLVFTWNDEYAMYKSLYEEVSDTQLDIEKEDEFEFIILFKIDEIKPPLELKYPVNERYISYSNEKVIDYITNETVDHQLLDKIIFPTILLHQAPCKLSSKETFNLVKFHIQQHINPKVARITSDYSFCFEVSKIITLNETYTQNYVPYSRGKRKPKTETRLISSRLIKIFEMTNDEDKYKGYTSIEGFEANSESELKDQIDNYLNDLMSYINEPLIDCPHCQGKGVLLNSKIEPVTPIHN
jgi:hypothetical protein